MGALMQAHGLGITDALKKIGILLTTCGWFLLWGGCGDPTCTLKHENTELRLNQVAMANKILSDGASNHHRIEYRMQNRAAVHLNTGWTHQKIEKKNPSR